MTWTFNIIELNNGYTENSVLWEIFTVCVDIISVPLGAPTQ